MSGQALRREAARSRAAVAPAPRERPPLRRAERPAAARGPSPRRRPRARMGLAWIPLLALLLGGIVWVNVAKLQLTTETSRVMRASQQAESDSIRLQARLAQSRPLIAERARARLDMRQPTRVRFLDPAP